MIVVIVKYVNAFIIIRESLTVTQSSVPTNEHGIVRVHPVWPVIAGQRRRVATANKTMRNELIPNTLPLSNQV